ncbi:hypothetical protein K493DRAFT_300471 [Basidiobolus meristosporus CBS 931.73]|uniref:Uncharacterized protein n=1 Tax=Basidiobolus meristosporus CBS 931.73 TaxID=1314790 RepID=A0A1Y1YI36_9FUNG|nr:hypothetical protein K493DRAFT_300471 [Basidiobolus meristosporus CBS 931.73]|eukprot:ORX97376.1 hypothetical protein K493DRAFT_300471 [Basidiobolus meristosporus CBS 931.73]
MKLFIFYGFIGAWTKVQGNPIDTSGDELPVKIDVDSSQVNYDRTNLNQALIIAMIILLSAIILGLLILGSCWALRKFFFQPAKVISISESNLNIKKTYRAGDYIRQKYGVSSDNTPLPRSDNKQPTGHPRDSKYGKYLTPPPVALCPSQTNC